MKILSSQNLYFFKNLKNYLVAEVVVKSVGLLILPIITRLLTPEEFGMLKVYESTAAFFVSFSGLAIPVAIKRFFYDQTNDFKLFAGSTINFIVLYNIVLALLIFIFSVPISVFIKISTPVLFMAYAVAFLRVFIRIFFDYQEASKNSKSFSKAKIIQGIGLSLFTLAFIYLLPANKFLGKIYSDLSISILMILVLIPFYKSKIFACRFNTKYIKEALAFSLPIIPGTLSSFALAYFDTIIINQLVGSRETGMYALAYQIGMILNIINLSSLSAFQPEFFEAMKKNDLSQVKSILQNYIQFIFFITSGLLLFSVEIGVIFSPKSYHDAFGIIPVVILGYLFFFFYSIYFQYIIFFKKTPYSSAAVVVAGIANISLNYMLIPKFGYFIAGCTTLIAYSLQFAIVFFSAKKFSPKELFLSFTFFKKNSIWVFIALAGFYASLYLITNFYIAICLKLVLIVITGWAIFRKDLKTWLQNK